MAKYHIFVQRIQDTVTRCIDETNRFLGAGLHTRSRSTVKYVQSHLVGNADNSEMDQEASSRVLRTHSQEQVSMGKRRSASMSREQERKDGRGMGKEYNCSWCVMQKEPKS